MRHLLHISLLLVLLSVAVSGCRPSASDAERRLIALDSLIATAPDSALTLLSATDTATLSEPERAYLALLLTQAMYKAYIPATSDTLIGRAWRYYEHSGPYDRRVRALLYQGTVAEELGRPEQAMRWYKQAEDYARPDDHYNRGFIAKQIGFLYQDVSMSVPEAVASYKEAVKHFAVIGDTQHSIFCQTQIGRLYQCIDVDSAIYFINEAIKSAALAADTFSLNENRVALASCSFLKKDYRAAIYTAERLIHTNNLSPDQLLTSLYLLCHSFTDMGLLDSAVIYFNQMPNPQDAVDSVKYFRAKAEIARLRSDIEGYVHSGTCSAVIADSIVLNSSKVPLNKAALQTKIDKLHSEHSSKANMWFLALVGALLAGLLLLAFYLWTRRQYRAKLSNLENDYNNVIAQLETSGSRVAEIEGVSQLKQEAYAEQLDCIRGFFDELMHAAPRRTTSLKPNLKQVELSDHQWQRLSHAVDVMLNGFVTRLAEDYGCNENAIKMFCLSYCGASNNMVEMCLPYKLQSIANTKQRIAHRVLGEGATWNDLLETLKKGI